MDRRSNQRALARTLALGCSILVVQLVGALWSGSLALLADTVHVFADVFGVGLALVAVSVAARPTKARRTFGLFRLEILATVANATLLLVMSAWILFQAWHRWFDPETIDAPVMIAAAAYGLVANTVGMLLLRAGSRQSLTVRGAYLEVMSDAIGSAGVVVAGVVVLTTGWTRIDCLVSLGIALFIVPRAIMLLRESLSVLMESAPAGLDLEAVREHMVGVEQVVSVHDLHAWTITSGMVSLSAHVIVEPDPYTGGAGSAILEALDACLLECFDIQHTTFQLESQDHFETEDPLHP
ncbi:MAG: cation diffusion facilitator family transporter [Actinomycetes bacterium]